MSKFTRIPSVLVNSSRLYITKTVTYVTSRRFSSRQRYQTNSISPAKTPNAAHSNPTPTSPHMPRTREFHSGRRRRKGTQHSVKHAKQSVQIRRVDRWSWNSPFFEFFFLFFSPLSTHERRQTNLLLLKLMFFRLLFHRSRI